MGQSLPSTFTKKRLGQPLYKYTIMVHTKKAWQLHRHINLINFFLKKKKKKKISTLAVNISQKKFLLQPSSRSHYCHIPCCIPKCMQGLSGDYTSLPLSFWSWIGLVISGGWRCSYGHIINRAWLCTAYSWVVCMTILGCLQAQAQAQAQ